MPEFKLRQLNESDWPGYRNLRLQALSDDPDAFAGTYEDAIRYSDKDWSARLSIASPKTDLPLIAEVKERAVGLSWGKLELSHPQMAYLYQMWVHPEFRGLGIGKSLLDCVVSWAKLKGAHTLTLGVTSGVSPAWKLYELAGFKPKGELESLRYGSDLLSQAMELDLLTNKTHPN
jgi:ribosomal protein S18 acetylase RimI-like enzyme